MAAYQLKSGDIQIFTSSTADTATLKRHLRWTRGLGERAELVVPTYGVIVHGIPTNSINIKNTEATIQQILADNHTVIPKAEITYVGWLTREGPSKQASSIVVEFKDPSMANAIIYTGMVWEGQIHTCQLYDPSCRIKQCFRCNDYGHIGPQCDSLQICGYCAEPHESRSCKQKGVEGFPPRCTVCKGAHTAWSPDKKKELARIEHAKRARSTYWQVTRINTLRDDPPRDDTPQDAAPQDDIPQDDNTQTTPHPASNPTTYQILPRPAAQVLELSSQPTTIRDSQVTIADDTPLNLGAPSEPTVSPTPVDIPIHDDWATPETQQDNVQQLAIDPMLLTA